MNDTVRGYLAGMPNDMIDWLESLRNKNPLAGSNAGKNANSVFVEIGKNLIVEAILDARKEALHPGKPKQLDIFGTDIIMKPMTD